MIKNSMRFLVAIVLTSSATAQHLNEDLKAASVDDFYLRTAISASIVQVALGPFSGPPTSKSHVYRWLEQDTEKRSDFLKQTQSETQSRLLQSPQIEKIKKVFLPENFAKPVDESTVVLSAGRKLVMVNQNFSRTVYDVTYDTSIIDSNGNFQLANKTEVFSEKLFTDKKAYITGLFPSPDKKMVGILVSFNGSIDNTFAFIYDVESKSMILEFEMTDFDYKLKWYSATEVLYVHPESSAKGFTSVIHDLRTGKKLFLMNKSILPHDANWVGYRDLESGAVTLKYPATSAVLQFVNKLDYRFGAEDSDHFFLIGDRAKNVSGSIVKVGKQNDEMVLFAPAREQTFLSKVYVLKKKSETVLAAHYVQDATNTLVVYKMDGSIEREAALPVELSLANVSYDKLSESYGLSVISSNKTTTVKWLESESAIQFEDALKPDPTTQLDVVVRLEYFKSADGTMIPARISYKKGLEINGQNPVFIDVYGGFFATGNLGPVTNKTRIEFIRRGGVHVGLGVRGGNERGFDWYLAGAGKNKNKTNEDVIGIAKGLVERGYTTAKKIAICGTSNGGYVVASSALLSPQSFGLVIPINGVQDQMDFSSLDRWGFGWEKDYLDPYDFTNFSSIMNRSPLEIAAQLNEGPEFLIINGEFDTRVNKIHSYKLKARLDELATGKAILFSVDRAGHWPVSTYLIDDIGISASAVMWAKIFDYMGMEF